MADIRAKERAIVTLTSTGASMTTGSYAAVGTDLDARAAGNAADDLQIQFELTCQWAVVTGMVNGTIAAELYLLPKMDGTNLPTFDGTSGAAVLPASCFVASLVLTKTPTANTNVILVTPTLDISPRLYTPHLRNRSGNTISANWSFKFISDQAQTV